MEGLEVRSPWKSFSGSRVFITGHTGFKGSWLSLWLHRLGAELTGYSLPPPTEPNLFELAAVRSGLAHHHLADVRDFERLNAALHTAAPDFVFHLAAQPLVRESYASPRETFDSNVMGTVNVLEAVRRLARPCVVVVVTSDKAYDNPEQPHAPLRETDPLGGHDPYSASKGAAELVTASYRRSFFPPERVGVHGVKLASARAGNVIGGGDFAKDRIVVDAVKSLIAGVPVPVRNPMSIRPFQHVLEPLAGYLTLAACLREGGDAALQSGFNFGPHAAEEATVRELVERLIAAWGSGSFRDESRPGEPAEAKTLRLSIDKALSLLPWRPRFSLSEAVQRTAAWYQRWADRDSALAGACFEDIAAYEAKLEARHD